MNAFAFEAVPPSVVTDTDFEPAVCAGVRAVSVVALVTDTLVAATPPTVTVVAPVTKFVPVTVISVFPVVGPVAGLTAATVGAAR